MTQPPNYRMQWTSARLAGAISKAAVGATASQRTRTGPRSPTAPETRR